MKYSVPIETKNQTILFNKKGFITTSTDVLFSTESFNEEEKIDLFPFVESVLEILNNQAPKQILHFEKVTTIHDFLPGIYDYDFVKLTSCVSCQEIIIWNIFDKTEYYEQTLIAQQIRQEEAIRLETIA